MKIKILFHFFFSMLHLFKPDLLIWYFTSKWFQFLKKINIYMYYQFLHHCLGFLGGLFIIGVGFTPADIYRNIHFIFAIWFIRFFLISSIIYIFIFLISKKFKSIYSIVYVIYSLIILIHILIGEFGPKISDGGETALKIHVISQKIIAFSSILLILFQTFINKKLILTKFYK